MLINIYRRRAVSIPIDNPNWLGNKVFMLGADPPVFAGAPVDIMQVKHQSDWVLQIISEEELRLNSHYFLAFVGVDVD